MGSTVSSQKASEQSASSAAKLATTARSDGNIRAAKVRAEPRKPKHARDGAPPLPMEAKRMNNQGELKKHDKRKS